MQNPAGNPAAFQPPYNSKPRRIPPQTRSAITPKRTTAPTSPYTPPGPRKHEKPATPRPPAGPSARRRPASRGVATRTYYNPLLHLQPAYEYLGKGPGSFPGAEGVADRMMALPVFPQITDEQVEAVAAALIDFTGPA